MLSYSVRSGVSWSSSRRCCIFAAVFCGVRFSSASCMAMVYPRMYSFVSSVVRCSFSPVAVRLFFNGMGRVAAPPLPWWSPLPPVLLSLEWEDVLVCVFVLLLCCCFLDSVFDFSPWYVSEFFCCVSDGDGVFCSALCPCACYFYWSDYSVYVCDCSHGVGWLWVKICCFLVFPNISIMTCIR